MKICIKVHLGHKLMFQHTLKNDSKSVIYKISSW